MPPDQRIGCTTSIAGWCANSDIGCVMEWSQAQMPSAWAIGNSVDGCARVATQPCAGYFIAEPGAVPMVPRVRDFYAAETGDLIAIVQVNDPTRSACTAGPPDFTDPLVLNCEPPMVVVCGPDAGAGSDAGDAGDSGGSDGSGGGDGAYADGGLTDGALGD
jgi:hypothetical protein